MPVIMTGYMGLKGTAVLAESFGDRINERYPAHLVRNAVSFGGSGLLGKLESAREIIIGYLKGYGIPEPEECFVSGASEGGILTALYDLAGKSGVGFELDLRKIPVRQETIEICELLEVNPYHLYSEGCYTAIVPEAEECIKRLKEAGINACAVGYTTDKKAHILHNDGTESHLNRPEPDELVRLGLI